MNHFSEGKDGKPSSAISLDKNQFMSAITDLLENSQWEYLLGSPEWEKQLDLLFNKVIVGETAIQKATIWILSMHMIISLRQVSPTWNSKTNSNIASKQA